MVKVRHDRLRKKYTDMMIFRKVLLKRKNYKIVFKKVISSLLVTITAIFATFTIAQEQDLDAIAAVVNSDVIMVSELRNAAQQAQARQQDTDIDESTLFKQVLEKMILDKIQVQKAKAIGIKIDDAAVDSAMQVIAKQNNLDLQQLRVAIIQRGMDYKNFRESIRDRLYSDNLRKRQQGRNNIAENEVDDLIQAESFNLSKDIQYQIIDILVPNNTKSVQQFNVNLNRAQNIRKKLLLNANLSTEAITKMGGTKKDLGWQNAETLSPVYSRTLSLMGEGELSNVIRDQRGFHILKLVKQRGGKKEQITEAKVRHILISKDDPQAKLKITQLRNKILAGESFAQLATKFSADKGSAANGGELPTANTKNYVALFANTVDTIALKTLSQPVKTQFGWHIIEVLERQKSDKTRESIKNKAKSLVGEQTQKEQMNNWLKSLRDEAFVEYRIKL